MTAKLQIGNAASGISIATFAGECIAVVTDLRWLIILAGVLIAGDFWWGWRECKMHRDEAKTEEEKKKYEWHKSLAIRRTLNKVVDYTSYLLVGAVFGMGLTEPFEICDHTTTAAVGMIFGCVCEVSSIFGHIAYVKGVRVKIDIKRLSVEIIRRKSEALAEILDAGIEHIDDGTRKHHARHPHRMPPMPLEDEEDDMHHCGDDIDDSTGNEM